MSCTRSSATGDGSGNSHGERPGASASRRSTSGYLRPDPLTNETGDLSCVGVPAERRLREDQLSVECYLESSLRRREQCHVRDDWSPAAQQLVRQTDGTWDVVSGNAELDLEVVPGVKHGAPPYGMSTTLPPLGVAK
jgi:hypothetical protein